MVYYRFDEKGLIGTVANDTEAMEDISQPREIPVALDRSVRLRCVRAFLCRSEARADMSGTSGGSGGSTSGLSGDVRAQSETIGVVLFLGIVILGVAGVVTFGNTVLNDLQSESELEEVKQAMTVFDSRAAMVALGESDVQSVPMGQTTKGSFSVHAAADSGSDPAAGSIKITHIDYDGSTDVVLYKGGLGSVIYERDGTEIAYQGGGVWKKNRNGEARMLSPPELHYQGSTLTLPIIQAEEASGGGSSGGGAISATIRSASASDSVFPDASATYPNSQPYENSVQNGEIKITIESEYASGWEEYFKQRTDGTTVTRSGNTVEVTLTPIGTQGPFPMPPDGSFISVQGFKNDHPSFVNDPYDSALDPFEITLRPDDTDSAEFANLQWGLYIKQGNQEFEIHLRRQSGKDCSNPPVVSATIYYTNDYGNTYQGWYDPDAFTGECGDFDGDSDDEIRLVADLAGSDDMKYGTLSSSKLGDEVSIRGGSLTDPVTFDQHTTGDATVDGTPRTYTTGNTVTMGRLVDHYFASLGPSFSLIVDDKNSDTVTEGASYGNIQYPDTANSITFLHVTENEIEVEFE